MSTKKEGKNKTNTNETNIVQKPVNKIKKDKNKKKKKVSNRCNDRLIQFARLYFVSKDKNQTQAYIDAGYSPRGAWANASRALNKPIVKEELKRLAAKQEKRLNINSDEILSELMKSAMSDIRELFDDCGNVLNPNEWPEHIARAVSSIKIEEIKEWNAEERKHEFIGYTKHIKLWDKTACLRMLGQHLKLFKETLTLEMPEDFIEAMKEGQRRIDGNPKD